jgi:hypothetical protein
MREPKSPRGRPSKNSRVYRSTSGNREIERDLITVSFQHAFGGLEPDPQLVEDLWRLLSLRLLETDNPYLAYSEVEKPIKQLKKGIRALNLSVKEISSVSGHIGRGHGVRLLNEIRDRYSTNSNIDTAPRWDDLVRYLEYVEKNIDHLFSPEPSGGGLRYHDTTREIFALFEEYGHNVTLHENCPTLNFMIKISETFPNLLFAANTVRAKTARYEALRNAFRKRHLG